MAPNSSFVFNGALLSQVMPRSAVRSICTRHPSSSLLEGQSKDPSARVTGLFRTGPICPSGRRLGFDQLCPLSWEVIIIPHHREGLGPTL